MVRATWPAAVARRIGCSSAAIDFTPTRVGLTLHIPCAKGKHLCDFEVEPGAAPDLVAKRMLSKGWTFGSKIACPEHSRRERVRTPTTKEEPKPMATAPAAAPTPGALATRRAVIEALQIAYDAARQNYTSGYTDERIASETGAAVEFVRKFREENFGPLREPSEIAALREKLATAQTDLDRLKDAVGATAGRIAALSSEIDRLAINNGWRTAA